MRITCPNCGGAHPAWDCKRPATKSTATWVVTNRSGRAGSTPASSTIKGDMGKSEARPSAGNAASTVKALPVDTNSEPLLIAAAIPQRMGSSPRKDEGTEAPNPKRPRGRPRIHPDRKAYKAQWERDKRKRLKDAKAKQG